MYKVLIVDDQDDVRATLKDVIQKENYEVVTSPNAKDALDKFLEASSTPFDFAVVDVRLMSGDEDDNTGLILSMTFKKMRPAIAIILLTKYDHTKQIAWALRYHGIFRFIRKAFDWDHQVLNAIKDAEKDIEKDARYRISASDTFLNIYLEEGRPPNIKSQGKYVFSYHEANPFAANLRGIIEQTDFSMLTSKRWKPMIENVGNDLWKRIFDSYPGVSAAFHSARAISDRLSITFETSRETMGLPLEFIRTTNPDKYLVLQYPVSRLIAGISPKREVISPEWLALKSQLSILVIASNAYSNIPGVESEAEKVRDVFMKQDYIRAQVQYVSAREATLDRVRKELSSNAYDIIHYAGHGRYDPDQKNNSALLFWTEKDETGSVGEIKAPELTDLLGSSNARLVYLSCCKGVATGPRENSHNDDFLGLADAVIESRIPSVLGFRSPVQDARAVELATCFYERFLDRGSLDVALWESRRKLATETNMEDATWLSPILISQH